jgi:hypothetical protein
MADDQDLFADQSKDQTGEETNQAKKYTLPHVKNTDGTLKELTADQVYEEANNASRSYVKASQELSEIKKAATPPQEAMPDAVKQELRKYGVVFQEDIAAQQNQIKLENEVSQLESKYDGTDGRPAFKRDAILEHMQKEQIFNPQKAYKDLYEKELQEFAIKQYLEKKDGIPSSEHGAGGAKVPNIPTPVGRMNDRDFKANLTQEIEKMMGGSAK